MLLLFIFLIFRAPWSHECSQTRLQKCRRLPEPRSGASPPSFLESWPAPWDLYAGTSDRVDGPPSTGCDSSDAEGVEAAVALTAKWSRGPIKGPVSNRA